MLPALSPTFIKTNYGITIHAHDELYLGEKTARFIVVKPNDLGRALKEIDAEVTGRYQKIEYDLYTLDFGDGALLYAIKSADPKFFLGSNENARLYSLTPPIENACNGTNDLSTVLATEKMAEFAQQGKADLLERANVLLDKYSRDKAPRGARGTGRE